MGLNLHDILYNELLSFGLYLDLPAHREWARIEGSTVRDPFFESDIFSCRHAAYRVPFAQGFKHPLYTMRSAQPRVAEL